MKYLPVRFAALAIVALLLTGCRYATVEYAENSATIKDKEEAKRTIQRIMSEQPNNAAPLQMTVSDESISINLDRRNLISFGSLRVARSIYYTTPDRLEILRRRSTGTGHVVIWRGKTKIYQVNCFSVDDAKRFVDAFNYMKQYNLTNKNNPTTATAHHPQDPQ